MEMTVLNDISVLHLFGEISFMELDRIERTLTFLKKSKSNKVILDMTKVDYVHYLVIKRLVDNARVLRANKGDLKLASVNSETKDVLKFCGADQHLEDYASIAECILSFLKQVGSDQSSLQ